MSTKDQTKNAAKPVDVKNAILWRIYVVMLMTIVAAVVILLQIGKVQYMDGEELRARADSIYIALRPVEAPRGNILAESGSLLATSLPYFQLHFDTKVVPKDTFMKYVDTLAACLARYVDNEYTIGAYRTRLKNARNAGHRYFPIRKNVGYLELEEIKKFPLFNKGGQYKSGLIIDKMSKRQYPFKMLAHRTVGYIRPYVKMKPSGDTIRDVRGMPVLDTMRVGLEEAFNHILSGEETLKPMKCIGSNIWVPLTDMSEIEPKAGKDVVTTLDINIQDITEEALLRTLQNNQADHGCAIVMEVATGEIKAIANIGFNKERTSYWETKNYAIAEAAEPGSTFKLATMMALFEHGYVKPTDTVNLNKGRIEFYEETMEDASYHGLTLTSVSKAFEISSNVGVARLANKYYNKDKASQKKYIDYLRGLQFEHSKLGFSGEGSSFIKDPDYRDWSGITVPWMSIGYESYLTPLQTLNLYNTIANNGQMMKPHIVKEIRAFGKTEQRFRPEIISRNLVDKKTVAYVKQLLESVVAGKSGTAKNIKPEHYSIAGKTGTAIINYRAYRDRGEAKKYRSSFAGYFPADKPVYSCIVVVTNPRVGFYGGRVAAPVFKEIADKCYSKIIDVHHAINDSARVYKGAKMPDLQVGFKSDFETLVEGLGMPYKDASTTRWAVSRIENDTLALVTRNIKDQDKVVPNVVGMGLRDALYLLENRNIRVKVRGSGKVKSQSIKPGRSVNEAHTIELVLG
ncbi:MULTISPECIES: penicillin-binding protein [unclassified Aureispira]|uniref:penicillin-binding protein n=1 Tax=unclassified Aureispira TaxID=2649989 RepID=UPI000697435C|nr:MULTISPECIES: penicillin-binding protein [unclassified Aureispira]WMX13829.1 penicillin-binding protein [Aureispira sp. CCB-E]